MYINEYKNCGQLNMSEQRVKDLGAENKELINRAIGIDLGTTYSCVGILRDDRQGNRTTPSFVAFTDTKRLALF
jgi:hypothetical protein